VRGDKTERRAVRRPRLPGVRVLLEPRPTVCGGPPAQSRKGGRRGGRGRISPVSVELKRLQEVFEKLCDDVLEGNVDKSAAAVAIQALNGARACVTGTLKAREQEEFEVRLQELEEALEASPGGRHAA
jgi:hypothetical protein